MSIINPLNETAIEYKIYLDSINYILKPDKIANAIAKIEAMLELMANNGGSGGGEGELPSISFDGNTDGLASSDIPGMGTLYKVSTATPSANELEGKDMVISVTSTGEEMGRVPLTTADGSIIEVTEDFVVFGEMVFIVRQDNFSLDSLNMGFSGTIDEKGVYVPGEVISYLAGMTISFVNHVDIGIESVSLSYNSRVFAGSSSMPTLNISPSDYSDPQSIQYEIISGSEYASIDASSGSLTGIKEGAVTVKVTIVDVNGNTHTASEMVTVTYLEFKVNSSNRAKIGYTGAADEELVIPTTFTTDDGYTYRVVSIDVSAFYDCANLKSVKIPASVTAIDSYAFSDCTNLEEVTFAPNSQLTSLGSGTFRNCSKLKSFEFPASVTSVNAIHFFDGCESLTSIEIPACVTELTYTFRDCKNLETVTFTADNQLTNIGEDAFRNCISLANLTLPSSLTNIGTSAFKNCKILSNIVIPDSMISIGENAFYDCTSLESINIPANVTNIGNYAFYCYSGYNPDYIVGNLQTVTFAANSKLESIGIWAFAGHPIQSIDIPDSVITIGSSAFDLCPQLESIKLPANLTGKLIGFTGCYNLKSLHIPAGVTYIGGFSANGLTTRLKAVTFAANSKLESIGAWAFETGYLESIEIPASVTSIGDSAFNNCTSLKNIYYKGSQAQWNAITKGEKWNNRVPATYVQCSDGTVAL